MGLLAACGEAAGSQGGPAADTSTASDTSLAAQASSAAPVQAHDLTAANLSSSIHANVDGFATANFDGMRVQVNPGGQVAIVAKPTSSWDEQSFITTEAEDALVAVKAIKGWYTGVTVIHVELDSDFTDQYGSTKTEPGAWIEFSNDTVDKVNADGLKGRTFEQPTDLFALADAYYIHPAVWKKIDAQHRGQLIDFQGGTQLVTSLPG